MAVSSFSSRAFFGALVVFVIVSLALVKTNSEPSIGRTILIDYLHLHTYAHLFIITSFNKI